jgi:hypothetical protein
MLRVLPPILMAAAMFAQNPPASGEKPPESAQNAPPEVEAALRARISRFYQLEVDGKFNQALQLVAEDTKDMFVGSSKPIYRGFQIQSIQYFDNFTKASAIVVVERMLPVEGFIGHPLAGKLVSRWKLENGQWCWYIDPKLVPASPFGASGMPMAPGMPVPGGASIPPGMPAPGAAPVPFAGDSGSPRPLPPVAIPPLIPNNITVDKSSVELKASGPSSDQVVVLNPAPWTAALTVSDPKVAGLTVKLDRPYVPMGQKAIISMEWSGAAEPPKTPVTVTVTVQRTKQTIPIKVSFAK